MPTLVPDRAAERSTFVQRLGLALGSPRFRIVMLGWVVFLIGVSFFPAPDGYGIDSNVYRNAFQRMLAGEDAYLVPDPDATAQSDGRPIYYFPPPPAAIVGGAVGVLPLGALWWFVFNVATMFAGYLVLRRLAGPVPEFARIAGPRARVALPLLAVFLFEPSMQQLLYGNQQSLVLLATAAMAWGLLRGAPAVTGLGLGAAILLKASPALFGLTLLVARRWRDLGWTVAVGAAGVLASLPLVGTKPWLDFVEALFAGSRLVSGQGYNMSPIAGWLPDVPAMLWVALTAVGMALAGRLPARSMIVVSIAVFVLGWPVQWLHYATVTLVAIALLLDDRRTWLAAAAAYVLFGFAWRFSWLPAAALLIVAALRPDWTGRGQKTIGRRLSGFAPTAVASPPPPAPRGSGSPG